MKIGLVTLGCDKNTVDTEYLAGVLEARGHEVAADGVCDRLDVVVVLTCGFIEAARQETFETLAQFAEAKNRLGNPRRLVMAGCLAQRLADASPDAALPAEERAILAKIDALAGVGRPDAVADVIERVASFPPDASAERFDSLPAPSMRTDRAVPRKRLDAAPYAYLKISDGCDHACSFCAIPAMKGPYSSVPRDILLDEARALVASGVREINLIGQDLAPYGRDLDGDCTLPDLLEDLCRIEGDFWLRLLYFYPAGLTPRFLEVFAREPKICKYLDIPLQHLDPVVLKAMRRPEGDGRARERIAALRQAVPDVALRTTMIVGFPGETSSAFKNLLRGVREIGFDRLGAFVFSPEAGTNAAEMPDRIDPKNAERRLGRLMETQAEVSLAIQKRFVGRRLRILVESIAEDGSHLVSRSYREAPEVDGVVIVEAADCDSPDQIARAGVGDFIEVDIVEEDVHDLYGRITKNNTEMKFSTD